MLIQYLIMHISVFSGYLSIYLIYLISNFGLLCTFLKFFCLMFPYIYTTPHVTTFYSTFLTAADTSTFQISVYKL